jgi:DNA primase
MLPSKEILDPYVQGYKDVVIWFDNDLAGIKASSKVKEYLGNNTRSVCLPENLNKLGISDPSDMYYKQSEKELVSFMRNNL